jgi:hypothetical protein
MTQKTFERVRRIELELDIPPSHYEPGQPTSEQSLTHTEPERSEQQAVRM